MQKRSAADVIKVHAKANATTEDSFWVLSKYRLVLTLTITVPLKNSVTNEIQLNIDLASVMLCRVTVNPYKNMK